MGGKEIGIVMGGEEIGEVEICISGVGKRHGVFPR